MSEAKRHDSRRRAPTSRPGRTGESKARRRRTATPPNAGSAPPADAEPSHDDTAETPDLPAVIEPIRRSILVTAEAQSEQRLGFTARRAAILAAVVCVLTLTIAGPVRTYFAQRTETNQLMATQEALRAQIGELEQQKAKLADPVFIAAQARERLGFVMPGDVPYQVQLPPSTAGPADPGAGPEMAAPTGPWYTALWNTIADTPHPPPAVAPPPLPADVPPPAPPPGPPDPARPGG